MQIHHKRASHVEEASRTSKNVRRKECNNKECIEGLEAVKAALLLLTLADGVHPLLELLACRLSCLSLLTLFFDCVHAPAVILQRLGRPILELFDFTLQLLCALLPGIAVGLDLFGLFFQVSQSFLQRLCELTLGIEVLLDAPDTSLLVFGDLGNVNVVLAARAVCSWRGGTTIDTWATRCTTGQGGERNSGRWRRQ